MRLIGRPARVDHHAEHRVEQQRQHAAVHRIVAADVVPAELHASARRRRARTSSPDTAASAGCRRPAARAPGWPGRRPRPPRTGRAASPALRRGRRPAPRCRCRGRPTPRDPAARRMRGQEPAEPRTGLRRFEIREPAVLVVVGVDAACGSSSRHATRPPGCRGARSSDPGRARRRCTKHVLRQALPAAAHSRAPWRAGRRTHGRPRCPPTSRASPRRSARRGRCRSASSASRRCACRRRCSPTQIGTVSRLDSTSSLVRK